MDLEENTITESQWLSTLFLRLGHSLSPIGQMAFQADRAARYSPLGLLGEMCVVHALTSLLQRSNELSSAQMIRMEEACIRGLHQRLLCPLEEIRRSWDLYSTAWHRSEEHGVPVSRAIGIAVAHRVGLDGSRELEQFIDGYLTKMGHDWRFFNNCSIAPD